MKGFDDLKGMEKSKEILHEDNSNMIKLFEIVEKSLKKFYNRQYGEYRSNQLKKDLDFDYNSIDIENMINLLDNYDFKTDDIFSLFRYNHIFGELTGEMIKTLDERQFDKQMKSRIEINGRKMLSQFLFSGISTIDEIIIRNFESERFCGFFGSDVGEINTMIFSGNTGFHGNKGQQLMEGRPLEKKGSKRIIKNIVLNNNKFSNVLYNNHGTIDLLIATNNEFGNFCKTYAKKQGFVINNLILVDNGIKDIYYLSNNSTLKNVIYDGNNRSTSSVLSNYPCTHIRHEHKKQVIELARNTDYQNTEAVFTMINEIREVMKRYNRR